MRRGFTLVELLVTIAIIAILLGLLLPAVSGVRESGRILQCKNNLRTIALGCIQHENAQGFFPHTGGFYEYTGDPDAGFGSAQGGGWLYNILPFIDRTTLHQHGAGLADKRATIIERVSTVVPAFICPDRGSGHVKPGTWFRYPIPTTVNRPFARTDYGGNKQGLIGGMVRAYEVTDGLSNVILCGERNLDPDRYWGGGANYDCNEHGWTTGADHESLCRGSPASCLNFHMPIQDTPGVASVIGCGFPRYTAGIAFGGPHARLNVAMGDGSIQAISYSIQDAVLNRLSSNADGGSLEELGE